MILYSLESLWNYLQDYTEVHLIWISFGRRLNRWLSEGPVQGHRKNLCYWFLHNSSNSVFLWVLSSCFALLTLFNIFLGPKWAMFLTIPMLVCPKMVRWEVMLVSTALISVTTFFLDITRYNLDTQCTYTHLYERTSTNSTPIFEDWAGKFLRLTKSSHVQQLYLKRWSEESGDGDLLVSAVLCVQSSSCPS